MAKSFVLDFTKSNNRLVFVVNTYRSTYCSKGTHVFQHVGCKSLTGSLRFDPLHASIAYCILSFGSAQFSLKKK